jgi:hypothetical protein
MSAHDTLANLLKEFRDPPRDYTPVPIWWWSGGRIEPARIQQELQQFARGGVFNVMILNLASGGPMYGCDADDPLFLSEDWWRLFLYACDEAAKCGIRIWFYDQIGFSGANLQGQLVSTHPAWSAQALATAVAASRDEALASVPARGKVLGTWPHPQGARVVYTVDRGFDYFNPEACAALLDLVHGEMERRAGNRLGRVIAGSFQDELPSVPDWSPGFAAAFQSLKGYAITDRLPALWGDETPGAAQVRLDYHQVRAELAEAAFFKPLQAWHDLHGLLCGCDQQGPSRAGEPIACSRQYADYTRTHRWYSAPGCDHEGHAKLHSSLAHLYQRPRVWLEAFHSTGWGGTLEETFDWLLPWLRAGVTLYSPHAAYYTTRSGWWEWAAPSTCWRQPYWRHYPLFARAIARLCRLLSRGAHVCDTAVLYPAATVQAGLCMTGPDALAQRAADAWKNLTGSMHWWRPQPGWLDQWRRDYDALDEDSLALAEIQHGTIRIADEAYQCLVLPCCAVLTRGTIAKLNQFAEQGGRLIILGDPPSLVPEADRDALAQFDAHTRAGRVMVAKDEASCRAAMESLPRVVDAPVPVLHRKVDGLHLLYVTAVADRVTHTHPWPAEWWKRRSYDFDPSRHARTMEIKITGACEMPVLLDPFEGRTTPLPGRKADGSTLLTLSFDHGPVAVVAWQDETVQAQASELPAPPNPEHILHEFTGAWTSTIAATGELGDNTGMNTAVETVSFRHRVEMLQEEGLKYRWYAVDNQKPEDSVQAGFGRYGWKMGPLAQDQLPAAGSGSAGWSPVVYSLAKGIHKDPVHIESQGPKGHVPEDFIHFGTTRPGEGVQFRTSVWREAATETWLALGAAGAKTAWVNGTEYREDTKGFHWLIRVPLQAGSNELEWRILPEESANLRAYWALVEDPEGFQRPEWLEPADDPVPDTSVRFQATWFVAFEPHEAALQLVSDAPCSLLVNGEECGRQGGFDPYKVSMRAGRYQLHNLRAGTNDIIIEAQDMGRPVRILMDALARDGSGLRSTCLSNETWSAARDDGSPQPVRIHREQFKEMGWSHLYRRPHPLPAAAWLEKDRDHSSVAPVVPDALDARETGAEWLFWTLPPGALWLKLPVATPARLWIDGLELTLRGRSILLPATARGRPPRQAAARIESARGRHGGGLLDGPVQYEFEHGLVTLADWSELGLESYSGGLCYSQSCMIESLGDGPYILDLGRVRGTAEAKVNGILAGARFLSPYRFDITHLLKQGNNRIEITVFNTLAPWLEAHSPTRYIFDGQCSSGLRGPVRILTQARNQESR